MTNRVESLIGWKRLLTLEELSCFDEFCSCWVTWRRGGCVGAVHHDDVYGDLRGLLRFVSGAHMTAC